MLLNFTLIENKEKFTAELKEAENYIDILKKRLFELENVNKNIQETVKSREK